MLFLMKFTTFIRFLGFLIWNLGEQSIYNCHRIQFFHLYVLGLILLSFSCILKGRQCNCLYEFHEIVDSALLNDLQKIVETILGSRDLGISPGFGLWRISVQLLFHKIKRFCCLFIKYSRILILFWTTGKLTAGVYRK